MVNPDSITETPVSLFSTLRIVLPVAGLVVLWSIETLRPVLKSSPHRLRHAIRNLSLAAMNAVLLLLTIGTLSITVAEFTQVRHWGLLPSLPVNSIGRTILGVVLLDAWTWGWHRANHIFPFLWRFHRVHHSDAAMDVTTAARFHIGELSMAALIRLPVILLFGLSPLAILLHETILVSVSQFHHAAISLGRLDRIVRWFIVTPVMHKIHHSRHREETNSNYASILPLWDRLFGTYRAIPTSSDGPGLNELDGAEWQSIAGMLQTPLANLAIANDHSQDAADEQLTE